MKKCIIAFAVLSGSFNVLGQSVSGGSITGNAEATFQYLNADPLIGATQPAEKGLLNSYMNVFYSSDHFKAGGRFESYLPRINGYPNRFDGTGLGMRYAGYVNDYIDVTIGNFYEQFGSGTIFRAYEDRNLGYDNAMDGARIILRPIAGVQLKGVYGNQRYAFQEGRVVKSTGVTRGFDAQFHINELTKILDSTGVDLTIGGAFVSKYQVDDNELYVLPQNVGSYSGRINARYKKFTFNAEYTHKENDPSDDNGYIYNSGHAALINLGYSKRGLFGISVSAKSVDNMSYRSDRTKGLADLFINYLPAMNKTHTYNLVATLYPYATQPLGEIAFQTEIQYNIKKGKIGNKYDIPINFNYSTAYMPIKHTEGIIPGDSSRVTYVGRPFDKSDSLMWQDINVNVTYKFSKNLYIVASYFNIMLNNDISKISEDATGIINAHIGVIETAWKINKKHSLRTEIQGLFTTEKKIPVLGFQTSKDKGNWATVVLEYNISPNWFFGFMDQYNYGNPHQELRLHYAIGSVGWIKDATRVTLNYGRQRAGLFCVGGVCRFVPASNGLTLSITQSF